MAHGKGTSNRGSANVVTPSLDSLLSPTISYIKPSAVVITTIRPAPPSSVLTPQSDRRFYNPNRFAVHATPRAASQLVPARGTMATRVLSPRVMFAAPSNVALCVRRRMRREVLHALNLTHKAGRSGKPRRYNRYSQVKC